MAKSNARSQSAKSDLSPYLKARLRPFMQPKLWVSTGIFCLSAFALVSMFTQPDQFLGEAGDDRGAAANIQANENLSPEERAIAAELDDLDVLLQVLDDEGTLEAAEVMVTATSSQGAGQKRDKKLPDLDIDVPELSIPNVDYGNFNSLPLVDLNPRRNSQTAIAGQPSGFVGVNSVSDNPALNLPVNTGNKTDSEAATNPLQAALDRYAPASSFNPAGATTSDSSSGTALSGAALTGTDPTSQGNALEQAITHSQSANAAAVAPTVSITNPTAPIPQAENPSNNAFTQLLNPQLVVPNTQSSTPEVATPTVPQVNVPQVAVPQVSSPQLQTTPQFATPPQLTTTPQFQTPTTTGTAVPSQTSIQPVGTPVYQQSSNGATNFGVQTRPPGQNIGGGQINTFSNP